MPEDLTIAVVRGLSWEALRPYAVSLTRTGFKGTKLLLAENISEETRRGFSELDFTIVDRVTPPSRLHPAMPPDWAYGVYRFLPAFEFVKQNPAKFRYVIWTDVRDVIFQADPSVWLEKHLAPNSLVVAGLGHAIKDCPWNNPWAYAANPFDHPHIKELEAVATGTFAGTSVAMSVLMEDIYKGCLAANHPHAPDQGVLQHLIRNHRYSMLARVLGMGETFSTQWFPAKNADPIVYRGYTFPVFDKPSGLVLAPNGEPFSIVHLYDRDPEWVKIMKEKYA